MVGDFFEGLPLQLFDFVSNAFEGLLAHKFELRVETVIELRKELFFELLGNFLVYIFVVLLG